MTAPMPAEAPAVEETRVPVEDIHAASTNRPSLFRMACLAMILVAGFATLAVAGMRAKARQQSSRDEASQSLRSDAPRVLTVRAERAPTRVEQILPGTATPLRETAVYARTSGYLKRWLVDIGDPVKEGQLLGEIETPEIDAQLLQARATLNESQATLERTKASAELARVNLGRIRQTFERGVGSKQDLDEADAALKVAVATVDVASATIKANAANVKRLEDLQGFQKITAPFAGVITARNFDPGALVIADNSTARELFHLAQIDTLRVFADVPQSFATAVQAGQDAPVFRREFPGQEFKGTVTRTTNAVDPKTRTLRVEVDVPNARHALLPGMYVQVRFQLEGPSNVVRLPGAAIVTRAEGSKVAVLDSSNVVHYRAVKIGRDYGTVLEVVDGLSGGETIVVRPGDDLPEGSVVEPVSTTR
jgi:RND family efflux transporter MFP subunit